MKYGELPIDLGYFPIAWTESVFYLYLPIKMKGSTDLRIPERLWPFRRLVWQARCRAVKALGMLEYEHHRYLYITVKHMLVHPNAWGNRGGEHADGFGTDDLNWIWYDKNPTEFCSADFKITPNDDRQSLEEFRDQWDHKKVVTYPNQHLLELTPYVVHRVAQVTRYDMRTFVKISLSRHKFNLVGNSHNYLFDYKWEMFDRGAVRNMENYSNRDYKPADVG